MGNARAKLIWEANLPPNKKKPNELADDREREQWIRAKYEYKQYCLKEGQKKPSVESTPEKKKKPERKKEKKREKTKEVTSPSSPITTQRSTPKKQQQPKNSLIQFDTDDNKNIALEQLVSMKESGEKLFNEDPRFKDGNNHVDNNSPAVQEITSKSITFSKIFLIHFRFIISYSKRCN